MGKKYQVGRDSTVTLETTGWSAPFTAYRLTGVSCEMHDVTSFNTPTLAGRMGNVEKEPSRNVDPGDLELDLIVLAGNWPRVGAPKEILRMVVKNPEGQKIAEFYGLGTFRHYDERGTLPAPATGSAIFALDYWAQTPIGEKALA